MDDVLQSDHLGNRTLRHHLHVWCAMCPPPDNSTQLGLQQVQLHVLITTTNAPSLYGSTLHVLWTHVVEFDG